MSSRQLPSAAQRLNGKVALITGAASGIGLAAAKLFHRHGAKVVIADIQDALGQKACKEINSNGGGGGGAMYIHCDVTNEEDIAGAVDATVAKYGKLDIMYNNAGYLGPPTKNMPDLDKSHFEKVLSVNVVGGFLGSKHAARVMIPARQGSIIFTSSVTSILGGLGAPAYCASQHAIVGLCKSMAVDLGQFGVRANCVSPYVTFTPLVSQFTKVSESELYEEARKHVFLKGVDLTTEDIAAAALYFASDDSKYTSGHNLVVDAGYTIGLRGDYAPAEGP